jgi:hypothetical protein
MKEGGKEERREGRRERREEASRGIGRRGVSYDSIR